LPSKPLRVAPIRKDTLSPVPLTEILVWVGMALSAALVVEHAAASSCSSNSTPQLSLRIVQLRVAVLQQGRRWAARELVAGFLHRR
jgi:hypothetical protein